MDIERREQLAAAAAAVADEVAAAIVASWPDLWPDAATASGDPRAATAAVVGGLVTVLAQGDLDDRTWERTRRAVADAAGEDVPELLRSVRVVGVEQLVEHLADRVALTHEERWVVQREAAGYCAELEGGVEPAGGEVLDALLVALAEGGVDAR